MLEKMLKGSLIAFILEIVIAFVALVFHLCGNNVGIVIAFYDSIVGLITTIIAFVTMILI